MKHDNEEPKLGTRIYAITIFSFDKKKREVSFATANDDIPPGDYLMMPKELLQTLLNPDVYQGLGMSDTLKDAFPETIKLTFDEGEEELYFRPDTVKLYTDRLGIEYLTIDRASQEGFLE